MKFEIIIALLFTIGATVCIAYLTQGMTLLKQALEALKDVKNCHHIIKDLQKKREFVGLTDEEFNELYDRYVPLTCYALLIEKVEAKLKQKNGYAEEKNS